ncbi:MAG: hypothetical protein IPP25_21810 [Saprospiraceae bacterium]|nr:hypothetical protein [Candidatus Opimibacter skivensis]
MTKIPISIDKQYITKDQLRGAGCHLRSSLTDRPVFLRDLPGVEAYLNLNDYTRWKVSDPDYSVRTQPERILYLWKRSGGY